MYKTGVLDLPACGKKVEGKEDFLSLNGVFSKKVSIFAPD